ncbi:M48 family metalloprotease [Sphaerisporangium fuscum]|uniref:M48 family metalloprotease n=1 Tax=Sphaerisporangium fuscum TaxID=2835868 RepID=UPI001BDC6D37|nr:M48 family metalloprotease [Sphaerisporangium fuscum]
MRQALESCQRPFFLDAASWLILGMALLFGLALALYWLHPWWMIRRGRFRPLDPARHGSTEAALDRLRVRMGLTRPPTWLLAPRPRGSDGQAFGRFGRHYIVLDLGLAVRLSRGDPQAEAIVLHELAHLRNRDVGKTYMSLCLWWSFIVVAAVPFAALVVYQTLPWTAPVIRLPADMVIIGLEAPPSVTNERAVVRFYSGIDVAFALVDPYVFGLIPILAGLIYLARNAVLRTRETEADSTAARQGGALESLLQVLADRARTATAARWVVLRDHPSPVRRLEVSRHPALALRPSLTEFATIGAIVGLLAVNLQVLAEKQLVLTFRWVNTLSADLVTGLLIGPLLIGLFTVSLWRAAASRPAGPLLWTGAPLVLATGFLAGSLLPFFVRRLTPGLDAGAGDEVAAMRWDQVVVTSVLFAAGALVVSTWFLSVTFHVLPSDHHRRWAMPAVTAAAVISGTAWFSAWYAFRDTDVAQIWRPFFRYGTPLDGHWYDAWSYASGVSFPALDGVTVNPLTLPGLTLLWLVPVLVLARSETLGDLRRSLLIGAAGGLLVLAAGLALPFAARAALPDALRHAPGDGGSWSFPAVYWHTCIWIVVFGQVAVAAVTAASTTRLRPPLTLLAVSLTGLTGTAGVAAGRAAATCMDVFGGGRGRCGPAAAATLAEDLHVIAVPGVVLAVPAAVLGIALSSIVRRRRGRTAVETAAVASVKGVPTSVVKVTLTVLALAYLTATVVYFPDVVRLWLYWSGGPGAASGVIVPRG